VNYAISHFTLPGTGAHAVYYYDTFFCIHCLETTYLRLEGEHDSYQEIRFGATPHVRGAVP
jgi:hypothetical protein